MRICRKLNLRRLMNILSSTKAFVLLCLLAGSPLLASSDTMVSGQQRGAVQPLAAASVASLSAWAAPAKQEQPSDDDTSTPTKKTPAAMPPDSYLGAVVGTLFLTGMFLLMFKLKRRKPRKSVYRIGRYGYGRYSRSGSRSYRRTA